MRGKADVELNPLQDVRITPAYAGKRFPYRYLGFYSQDHPRLCGEKINIFQILGNWLGSPPPMRGKAPAYDPKQANNRITPAYAGKSFS